MFLNIQRKGKKLLLKEAELKEYMDAKLREISSLASSVVVALIMVSLITILTIFKAGDIYLYALIILPLVARSYVYNIIYKWFNKKFQDLIGINPNFSPL
jgi:hypothetical protein